MSLINEDSLRSLILMELHKTEPAKKRVLSEADLKALVEYKGFQDLLRKMVQQQAFTRKQAADYIGRSTSTIDRLTESGELQARYQGSIKYYRKIDLDAWINGGK